MSYNTIKIKKYSDNIEEYAADAAIVPGSLLELNSTNEVKVHATSGRNVGPKMFALEDELQGKGIDDAYAAGDKVQVWLPAPGDVVLGILADGQSVSIGSLLESNGAGYLIAHTPDAGSQDSIYQDAIVGTSLEDMDASADSSGQDVGGGLGANKRIKVRIV